MNDNALPEMTNSKNPFSLFIDVWISPLQAFAQLKIDPKIWYPLLAILLCQVGLTIYFSLNVDTSWMFEQMMANSGREISPEQQRAMEQMQGVMGGTLALVISAVSVIIMVPTILALVAGYFTLTSAFTADGIRFPQWLGMVCWSATPGMFASLASFVTVFLSPNGQIMQNDLNPLSLNSLFFHIPFGQPGSTLLSSVGLTSIWSLFLLVVGYKVWTGKSTATASLITLTPFVLVIGVVALFSFR